MLLLNQWMENISPTNFSDPEETKKHLTETIHTDEEKTIVPHDSLNSEQIDSLHEQQKSNEFRFDQ